MNLKSRLQTTDGLDGMAENAVNFAQGVAESRGGWNNSEMGEAGRQGRTAPVAD